MDQIARAFYRAAEVAEIIGLGRSKTYQLIASGVIPSVKFGKALRVPATALQKWIDDHSEVVEDRN